MSIPELDEAELKVMTKALYERGGASNVISALMTMNRCMIIISRKLAELIEEDNNRLDN